MGNRLTTSLFPLMESGEDWSSAVFYDETECKNLIFNLLMPLNVKHIRVLNVVL